MNDQLIGIILTWLSGGFAGWGIGAFMVLRSWKHHENKRLAKLVEPSP